MEELIYSSVSTNVAVPVFRVNESGLYQVELHRSGSVHTVGEKSPVGQRSFCTKLILHLWCPTHSEIYRRDPGLHSDDSGCNVCRIFRKFLVLRSTLCRILISFINLQPQNSKYWVDLRLGAHYYAWSKALKPAFHSVKQRKSKRKHPLKEHNK